jgi:hypothetical protein
MTWLDELQTLVAWFGACVACDMVAMNPMQLWSLYQFLLSRRERA